MLVALTTLSFSVAQAGDLSITGDAKASYAITSSDSGSGESDGFTISVLLFFLVGFLS